MIVQKVTVQNKFGLHARPSVILTNTCEKYKSDIRIKKGKLEVSGKSIMGVIMLAAPYNSELVFIVDGIDEKSAMLEIMNLFEGRFGEDWNNIQQNVEKEVYKIEKLDLWEKIKICIKSIGK